MTKSSEVKVTVVSIVGKRRHTFHYRVYYRIQWKCQPKSSKICSRCPSDAEFFAKIILMKIEDPDSQKQFTSHGTIGRNVLRKLRAINKADEGFCKNCYADLLN